MPEVRVTISAEVEAALSAVYKGDVATVAAKADAEQLIEGAVIKG